MSMAPPFEQVLDDLIKGQEFATRLQGLLLVESPEAGVIMDQILRTFSRAIGAAKAAAAAGDGSEVLSEVTSGRGKRKAAAAGGGGDGRAPIRRRTKQSSGNTVTMKKVDDGQPWRKYGQKDIQNSKHPKSYFRCTHKYDQQCAAQRHVQRSDENPEEFKVTYIGAHTCRDPAAAGAVAGGVRYNQSCGGLHAGARLISFAPGAVAGAGATPTTTASTTTTNGNDGKADAAAGAARMRGLMKLGGGGGGDLQEEVLSNLTPGCSAARGGAPAAGGPDQGDVTSALQPSGGGGPDMGGGFMGCDDFFRLEFDDIVSGFDFI